MVDLRAPVPADAEPAARCQLACWREAYTGLVDPVRLEALLAAEDERIARWREIVVGTSTVRLAVADGIVVGFAAVGPTREADGPERELYAIYVRSPYWGSGLGHRLLEATLGPDAASLWVLDGNVRARRFYVRHGFEPDGNEQEEPHFGGVEVRLRRPAQARFPRSVEES